ncbi:hypothetical protein ACGF5C_09720 [Micromonospora sp. NPDC047620]|uniref:hypothetical protein n=1 Tax=Micromonospora sp. NPDC047620 TaxID=3364251 RepID=UPI00372212A6
METSPLGGLRSANHPNGSRREDASATGIPRLQPGKEVNENVLHHARTHHARHVVEEEQEWFPKVREALGRRQLQEICERMIELRADAPRKPTDPKAIKKSLDAVTA